MPPSGRGGLFWSDPDRQDPVAPVVTGAHLGTTWHEDGTIVPVGGHELSSLWALGIISSARGAVPDWGALAHQVHPLGTSCRWGASLLDGVADPDHRFFSSSVATRLPNLRTGLE